jgi:lipopolysaccharide transport system permease protein
VNSPIPAAQKPRAPTPPTHRRRGRRSLSLLEAGIYDIRSRARLVRYLVGAELKRTHADTAIGQLWWILDPILQLFVYWVLVTIIFQRKTPDALLFLFCGILPWKWFSTSLNEAATSVVSRQSLVRQIQFPKIVLPTAATVAGAVSFVFGFGALAIMYVMYPNRLSLWILATPIVGAVQFVFTFALAIMLAAVNTFYRDVQNVLRHALRLWFYLSPALYSLGDLDTASLSHKILALNPMAPILTSYRNIWYGTDSVPHGVAPDWLGLMYVLVLSIFLLALAIIGFKRVEPAFARIL